MLSITMAETSIGMHVMQTSVNFIEQFIDMSILVEKMDIACRIAMNGKLTT